MMRWRQLEADGASDPLPSARIGHVAVAVDAREVWGEELIVVHGGIGEDKRALRDVVAMQVGDAHWFRPSPACDTGPSARAFHAAAVLGRAVYISGGHVYVKEKKGLQKFDDLWMLDTDSWQWTRVQPEVGSSTPPLRDFAKMEALPGSRRLLLFGGLDSAEKRLDDAWLFDIATATWTEIRAGGAKPKARYGHGLAVLAAPAPASPASSDPSPEARALLFGGETAGGPVNDLLVLRGMVAPPGDSGASSAAWLPLDASGNPPSARKGHAIASTPQGVVVVGGHTATVGWLRSRTDTFHSDVHLLAPSPAAAGGGLRWTALSLSDGSSGSSKLGEPTAREYHTLTTLSDGRLLLFGGGNGKEMFGDAWWLDMSATPAQQPQQRSLPQPAAAGPSMDLGASASAAPMAASTATSAPQAPVQQPQQPPQQQLPPQQAANPAWWESIASTARIWTPGGGAAGQPAQPPQPVTTGPLPRLSASGHLLDAPSDVSVMQQHMQGDSLVDMDSATASAIAAAASAAELESLRERLGLPPVRPAISQLTTIPAETDAALLALGLSLLNAAGGAAEESTARYAPKPPPAARIAAARAALASTDVNNLPLADVGILLTDYRRLALTCPNALSLPSSSESLDPGSGIGLESYLEAAKMQDGAGRFLHLSASDLRLSDVPQLLASYRTLVKAATAA